MHLYQSVSSPKMASGSILLGFLFSLLATGGSQKNNFGDNLEFPIGPGLKASIPRLCVYLPDSGRCYYNPPSAQFVIQWYYNTTMRTCFPFWYSQCGGNRNRFRTKNSCDSYCQLRYIQAQATPAFDTLPKSTRVPTVAASPPTPPSLGGPAVCEHPKDRGIGCGGGSNSQVQRWDWNEAKWACRPFFYKGCGGN